jgi:rod shape determining protein RodA
MNQERNILKHLPTGIIYPIIVLACIGLVLMYSASGGNFDSYFKKQLIYFASFGALMIAISLLELRFVYNAAYIFYGMALILLASVTFVGHTAMGATRWLNLGVIKLQPSELIKIGIVLALARYFHSVNHLEIKENKTLVIPILIILIPFSMIIIQPDLGTAMIVMFIGAIMLFLSGANLSLFVKAGALTSLSLPILWTYLHDYQKNRILMFLNPEKDKLGAGYNIIQSKIAIGSGGFFGHGGFTDHSTSTLGFLPEHQTDFIFPLFAEKFGFLGCCILLITFFILIARISAIAITTTTLFGRLLAFGLMSIMSLHLLINIGMTAGLLPVVGIPLPFLSYGGTALASALLSVGMVLSVYFSDRENF